MELSPVDALFVLYSLEQSGDIYGNLKLQKVGFWAELCLHLKNLRWPSFRYYRWVHGPYSESLQSVFQELRRRGFISQDHHQVSERGRFLLSVVMPELKKIPENMPVFQVVDESFARCSRKNGTQLKDDAYRIKWICGKKRDATMKDLPHGLNLVVPSPSEAGLTVPEGVKDIVVEELALTDGQIKEAIARASQIEASATESLRNALS